LYHRVRCPYYIQPHVKDQLIFRGTVLVSGSHTGGCDEYINWVGGGYELVKQKVVLKDKKLRT
jgi:hypothetical protein